jgi:hypothetical protein
MNDNKNPLRKILMALCMAGPILGMAAYIALNKNGGISRVGNMLPWMFLLLCPLSHVLMMFVHTKSGGDDGEDKKTSCH